jgi:hypothetical protein
MNSNRIDLGSNESERTKMTRVNPTGLEPLDQIRARRRAQRARRRSRPRRRAALVPLASPRQGESVDTTDAGRRRRISADELGFRIG